MLTAMGHWSMPTPRTTNDGPDQDIKYLNSCVAFELIIYFHHGISPLPRIPRFEQAPTQTPACNRHRLHPKLHTADLKVLSQIINLLNLRKLPLMIKLQILE
jgi:hypothetical protein